MNTRLVVEVDIDKIELGDRLRPVDTKHAAALALSMKLRGQISPIEVQLNPAKEGVYRLVVGAHRLAAAKMNGCSKIWAELFDGDADSARLREIDENLYRHELNPFDQANFLAERRDIWERVHGDLKRGGDRRSKGQVVPLIDEIRQPGFFADTAKKFGLHEKTVKRALTRRAQIIPALWSHLKNTEEAKNGAFLDKLRKLPVGEQEQVLPLMEEEALSLEKAVRQIAAPSKPTSTEKQLNALVRAWQHADESVRKKFLKDIRGTK
jgi:ParB family chromosome partitioning protein